MPVLPDSKQCPECGSDMIQRDSRFGPFLSCVNFPDCRGTRRIKQHPLDKLAKTGSFAMEGTPAHIKIIPGSPQQEAFYQFVSEGTAHCMFEARAGTGKTFSIVQAVLRAFNSRWKIGVVSFNNHIIREENEKFRLNGITWAKAVTYNALGYRSCKQFFPNSELFQDKLDALLDEIIPESEYFLKGNVAKLVRLCKCHLYDGEDYDLLDELSDKFDLEQIKRQDYHYVPRVLRACRERTGTLDFDDQCW